MIRKTGLYQENGFSEKGPRNYLIHESPYLKVINFNLKAGQTLPVHSHDIDGQLVITVFEGSGRFLGKEDTFFPAAVGDVLVSDISEPHGIQAETDMRVVVTIAPPI